ncbi:OmpA family protein [Wenyingzhuangia sp. IMCC45467]
MIKNVLILCLSLSCIHFMYAQTATQKRADKAFLRMNYKVAIKEYLELDKKQDLAPKQLLNLANSYYYMNEFKSAAEKYRTYFYQKQELSLEDFNRYIQSLKRGVYKKAVVDDAIASELSLFSDEIQQRYRMNNEKEPVFSKTETSYQLKNMNVNTAFSDFSVCLFPDQSVMFSSTRENNGYSKIYKSINQEFIHMYQSKIMANGEIDTVAIKRYQKEDNLHFSSPAYDDKYRRFFYTESVESKKGLIFVNNKNTFRILYGFIDDQKKIREEYHYPAKIDGYSYGQPYYDEQMERLYFVSDKPGGYGGTDIYYVNLKGGLITSEPINLGPKINTIANEMFPVIHDGVLYFSSNIFIGNGGLDVYQSNILPKGFELPKNMGMEINSIDDDFYYQVATTSSEQQTGYLSSNRKGGKGEDDIYYFVKNITLKKVKISGYAKEKKTMLPLQNALIDVVDAQGNKIENIKTDALGAYDLLLPIDSKYMLKASKEGHVNDVAEIDLTTLNDVNPIDKNFYLEKELVEDKYGNIKINLEPVYFEYDKADITPIAEKQLKFAIDFLLKYPDTKIKLEAHTDARGSKNYNLKLSDKRAKSVNKYLLTKGIQASRILSAKGFGETKLINDCSDGVNCTDQEHEQNRRTDFIIIEE